MQRYATRSWPHQRCTTRSTVTGTGRHTVLHTGECCCAKRSRSSSSASLQSADDVHLHADRAVAGGHRVVQREQPLQVDVSLELGRDRLDADAARGGVQHGRRGHAARQRVQQELDRIRALVVAEQHRRLAVRELERLAARAVLGAGAVEVLDRRAVLAAVDPAVPGPELELRERRVGLQRLHRRHHRVEVEPVQAPCRLRVHRQFVQHWRCHRRLLGLGGWKRRLRSPTGVVAGGCNVRR